MKNKLLLAFGLMFITGIAYAGNDSATILSNRESMVITINQAVILIGKLIGVILLLVGINKMKWKAEQPTNPQHSTGMIITVLVAGALMINYTQATTSFITSILYEDSEYCFILDPSQSNSTSQCWSASTSESTTLLSDRINRLEGNEPSQEFRDNIDVLMAFFQLIGLIYFFKGAYGLKQVSDGGQKGGYGKPLLTMLAAALVLDLPHTLEVIMQTIEQIGFSITS
jgi:hypothetical protein